MSIYKYRSKSIAHDHNICLVNCRIYFALLQQQVREFECVCIATYIATYILRFYDLHVHVYVYVCVHAYMCVCMCICVCMCVYVVCMCVRE